MRAIIPFSLVLVLGLATLARGDDPSADATLQDRVVTLELQVKYLSSREAAMTAYVVANEQRSAGLAQTAREARALGFAAGAVPAESRERILAGLETMSKSLLAGLPVLTKEQAEWADQISKRLKAR